MTPVVFSLPMRVPFRGLSAREGVLVQGPAGWGEFSPFTEYADAECVPWWQAAHEAAFDGWPQPVRDVVPVNSIVPAVDAAVARQLARDAGCATAKVKVAEPGQTLIADIERVAAVRDAVGPTGRVRVDANGAWTVEEAVVALRDLDRAAGGLEYAEQPCATVEELAALRRNTHVRIAADESIRRADDPLRVAELDAADVVVLKVAPLGGVRACLDLAERIGLPCVVSSAVESSVGLAAGLALAAALPELPFACGLGTAALLAADVTPEPLVPAGGVLRVRPVEPDLGLLAQLSPDPVTEAAWRDRLIRVQAFTGGES